MSKGYWVLEKVSTWGSDRATAVVKLKEGTNSIGRSSESDVKCRSVQVSRSHCSIKVENGRVYIKDNESFNGTYIGHLRLPQLREVSLENGDCIGIGGNSKEPYCHYVFKLVFIPAPPKAPTNSSARNCLPGPGTPQQNEKGEASNLKMKGEDVSNEEDASRKRSAMSPPPVPVKIPRTFNSSSTSKEPGPSGGQNVSNSETTVDQSETRNSFNEHCTTLGLEISGDQSDQRSLKAEQIEVHHEDINCVKIEVRQAQESDPVKSPTNLEVTEISDTSSCSEEPEVIEIIESKDQFVKKLEVENIINKPEVLDLSLQAKNSPDLDPFRFVNTQRGCGKKYDLTCRRSIENDSLLNASSFSQADEDIVEILDDDDESPCSQLFKPKNEMLDPIIIKEEVEDECESNNSDVEIIEEECSFFEEHFSQNYRETSPRKEENLFSPKKTNIKILDSIKIEEVEKNQLQLDEVKLDESSSKNDSVKTGNELVSLVDQLKPEKNISDIIDDQKINCIKHVTPDKDHETITESKAGSSDNHEKPTLNDMVLENTASSAVPNKLNECSVLPMNKKTRYGGEVSLALLCEALPLKRPPTKNCNIPREPISLKSSKITKKSSKKTVKEAISKTLKKRIAEERKEKLKRLSSKDKDSKTKDSMEKIDIVKESVKNSAPNCTKVTINNRGSFLTQTISEKIEAKGNIVGNKVTHSHMTRQLTKRSKPLVSDTKENKKTEENVEKKHTKNRNKEESNSVPDKQNEVAKMKKIPKKPVKKSVKFRDENLVEIREYECDGLLNKFQPKMKDFIPEMNGMIPRKYIEGTPTKLMDIVYVICKWNALWLDECKRVEGEPPLLDWTVSPLKESYLSFAEYQKMFTSLELYNLWATTVQDLDNSKIQRLDVAPISSEVEVIDPGTSKTMQKLHCCALVGKNDMMSSSYPKGGDFAVVEFPLKTDNRQGAGVKQKIVMAFGYVMEHARIVKLNHCRDHLVQRLVTHVVSSSTQANNLQLDSCVYFTLLIRQRDKKEIDRDCIFVIKILRNLNKDLRIFEGISMVPFSPLSYSILDPGKFVFPSPSVPKKTTLFWQMPLNESQTTAVLKSAQSVLEKKPSISLIHGPPGTGKTRVIIALILQILNLKKKESSRKQPKPKILLCAPSNTAVDELVLRLMDVRQQLPADLRFKMVRHGRRKVMHPKVAVLSTEALAERELISNSDEDSLKTELSLLRAQENALLQTLNKKQSDGNQEKYREKYISIQQRIMSTEKLSSNGMNGKTNLDVMSHQARRHMKEMEARVLHCADIVATTLSSAYSNQMKEAFFMKEDKMGKKFACCIVDEATQASEPESLQPLLLNVDNMILVGDPYQLQATVISSTAKECGLGQSLFGRLFLTWSTKLDTSVYKLKVQYRMHPEIVKWPATYFYNNQLTTAPNLETERNTQLVSYRVIAHNSKQDIMGESNTGESAMVINLVEAIQTCETLRDLTIGIIVPYQKQRAIIINKLSSMKLEQNHLIIVQTIDSYQGQERDIVIMSCVRTEGVGFLADPHRLNVALTRAKSSLIVFANFCSLQGSNAWNSMLNDAKKRGRVTELQNTRITGTELLNLLMKKQERKKTDHRLSAH